MVFKLPYVTVQPYMFLSSFVMMLHDIMLPQVLLDTNCKIKYNTTICKNVNSPSFLNEQYHIQKQSALWLTAIQSFQGVLCLVIVLFLGPFADVIGIRKAMFLTPVCTGVQYIICSLLTSLAYPFDPRLFLLIAFIISLCGYYSGQFLFATSYVAAVTSQKDRTFQIVILDIFYSLAVCLASFTSGYILKNLGFTWAYLICLILSVFNGLFILLFVEDLDTNAEVVSSDRKGTELNKQGQQRHCKNEEGSSERGLSCHIDSQIVSFKETKPDEQADHNYVDDGEGYQSCDVSSKVISSKREVCGVKAHCINDDNKSYNFSDRRETENFKSCKEVVGAEVIKDSTANDISNYKSDVTEHVNTDHASTSINVKLFFSQVNPLSQFRLLFRLLREQNRIRIVSLLLIASFVSMTTFAGEYNIIVLFIRNHPFDFDSVDVGYFLAFQNLIVAVIGGLVMNTLFQRCFVFSDMITITFALTSHGVYLILLGFSTSKSMLYSIQAILTVGALDNPILRSALTKNANSGTQGTLLSAIGTCDQLGFLCAGLTGPLIYAEFLSLHRGAVFFFLSIFLILASVATGIYSWKEKCLKKKAAQEAFLMTDNDQQA